MTTTLTGSKRLVLPFPVTSGVLSAVDLDPSGCTFKVSRGLLQSSQKSLHSSFILLKISTTNNSPIWSATFICILQISPTTIKDIEPYTQIYGCGAHEIVWET